MRTVDITSKGQMYTAPFENHKIGTGAISMFRPSTNLFLHRQSEEKRLHNLLKRTKRRTGLGCERCANGVRTFVTITNALVSSPRRSSSGIPRLGCRFMVMRTYGCVHSVEYDVGCAQRYIDGTKKKMSVYRAFF